jgi:hypothetical protein
MQSNGKLKRVSRVEDLPDAVVKCRAFGHGWDDPVILPDRYLKDGTYSGRLELRCDCGTVRPENVNSSGQTWGRHYYYPDFYSFSASKEDFRAEWVRRHMMKQKVSAE